jgi:hypothetical protein
VDSSKADIVCVQEIKIPNLSQRVILSALGTDFSDYVGATRLSVMSILSLLLPGRCCIN